MPKIEALSDRERPYGRPVTDDDLCTECYYLIHYPGSLSLCSRLAEGNRWPCAIIADGDALYCERFIDCQE
ncbi:antirestriction protein [Yersinia ruckeri]|uniref:Antirestriction protein n=1 Tax=Yersinia ruckeri TaxID=29486 RepID=A0A0A8VFS8_YERRU|nr:antirestriction protein [Yersinia ruckeri]MCK8593900.1 hypothetical protein [Yersinia ruckeri]MCK8598535.1 hypothetical protein [Yersinia ruckeri]MCW6609193.1 hypothetical protein [Yersinia ruckeri]MCW6615931.1 hypothetical protein [Yersinia ruckeri]MCW6622377.1 hypothetical protein [Yersinia ruckeri]